MEADFMEQPVRSLNNFLCACLLITLLHSCSGKPAGVIWLQSGDAALEARGDILFYNGQPFAGKLIDWHPGTHDTAAISNYRDGREDGEWIKFYPAHELQERRFYTMGEKTGRLEAWWPGGKKKLDYFFAGGEYEGRCREWNSEGRLVRTMTYEKGHEEGPQQCWYDNGKIRANYVMINGRRYGLLGTKNCVNVSDSIFKR